MPRDGLNISTQAGEGDAHIWHWEETDAAIQNIYNRDLLNQKNVLNEFNRLNIGLTDASKGLRPADMPLFKNNYDKFKQASLMMQTGKVRNNPQDLAFWKEQQDQAYLDNMSLAQRSEEATKTKSNIWKDVTANPEKYYDYDHLQQLNAMYDASPVGTLDQLQLNTTTPWLHPSDAYPQEQFDKHVLGDPKIVPGKPEEVIDEKTKIPVGHWLTTQEIYTKKPSQIAADMTLGMKQVWDIGNYWKDKWKSDSKQEGVVDQTMSKAQEIIDADPANNGYKLDKGYVGYAQANYILRGQPTTVGSRSWQTDPRWTEHEKDLDRKDTQNFQRSMLGIRDQYQKGILTFKQTLKDMGFKFSGEEMYGAATKPYATYVPQGEKNATPVYGFQLLDKRMTEIMSKAPKNLDYAILTKYTIATTAERRRIIDKLFGAPVAGDKSADGVAKKALYDSDRANDTQDNIKNFIDYLNSKGIDVTENDINNNAIPVVVDKIKGQVVGSMNPATHNFDQFTQQLAQILNSEKPRGDIDGDDYMQMIQSDSTTPTNQ